MSDVSYANKTRQGGGGGEKWRLWGERGGRVPPAPPNPERGLRYSGEGVRYSGEGVRWRLKCGRDMRQLGVWARSARGARSSGERRTGRKEKKRRRAAEDRVSIGLRFSACAGPPHL